MMGSAMARYTKADVNVIALIGERGRKLCGIHGTRSLASEGMARCSVLVIATSDRRYFVRMRAAYAATAAAEYFRDKGGHGRAFDDGFGYAFRHGCLEVGVWLLASRRQPPRAIRLLFSRTCPSFWKGRDAPRKGHDYGNLHRACRWR